MSETNGAGAPARVQLTVSGIQADLNNGLTRANIQSKYDLSGKDLKELFSHPKLKGLKTKVAPKFTLVDDTEDATPEPLVVNEVEEQLLESEVEVKEETTNEEAPLTISDTF